MDQTLTEVEKERLRGWRARRCGKAAMMRWILLDREIDDSASEGEGRDRRNRGGMRGKS